MGIGGKGLAVLLCALVVAVLTGPASARPSKAQAEFVQIAVIVPMRLWDEMGWLHRALEPVDTAGRPKVDFIRHGGKRVPVFWTNASASIDSTDAMLRYAARPYGGPYGGMKALLVERRLTAAERKLFTVVPLYTDADVLVTAPDNPLCLGRGVTLRRVQAALTGKPGGLRIVAAATLDGGARPAFGVTPKGVKTAHEATLATTAQGSALAAVGFQRARPALEAGRLCAVPIDGVAPTVASVRKGRYPMSRPVGLAFVNAVWKLPNMGSYAAAVRARFLERAKGAPGRAFLQQVYGAGLLVGW